MKGVHKWWEKLKVRHVLNYTCGFGFILEELIPIEGVDVTKWDKMFQSVPKFWNLAAEPGTVHCYTSSGPGVIVSVFSAAAVDRFCCFPWVLTPFCIHQWAS